MVSNQPIEKKKEGKGRGRAGIAPVLVYTYMVGFSSMARSFNVVTKAPTEANVMSFRVSRAPSCATKYG